MQSIKTRIETSNNVSIRSPHGCKGRLNDHFCFRVSVEVSIRSPHGCKGRLIKCPPSKISVSVSIRSPHGCKGRFLVSQLDRAILDVSIRSPHGCKGRWPYRPPQLRGRRFQSAPLTDVRGDTSSATTTQFLHPMFQSAPLTDVRGDLAGEYALMPRTLCFNPLPSRM